MTAAECLALLTRYRHTPRCRRCDHLDWALAQLQQVADAALAREAVERRVPAEQLLPRESCRPCPPLDAVIAWLEPEPPLLDAGTASKSGAR